MFRYIVLCFYDIVLCFNNTVLCFDNIAMCFDNTVLCFDNSLLCSDNTMLCLEKCLLCFKNCLLCLQIWATVVASPADILSGSSRNHSSPHERLLQPVATSVRLCFEATNQPSPIVSSLANGNFCKKRSCHPQGNFRETISVNKLFSFNSCFLKFMIFHVPTVWHVWMKPPKRSLEAN